MGRRKGQKCWCSADIKKRLDHFHPLLSELQSASPKRARRIIQDAKPCFLKLLGECALNILKETIKLNPGQYDDIRRHKDFLVLMSQPRLSLQNKKLAILKKQGGFLGLGFLLSTLGSLAASFAGKALGNLVQ